MCLIFQIKSIQLLEIEVNILVVRLVKNVFKIYLFTNKKLNETITFSNIYCLINKKIFSLKREKLLGLLLLFKLQHFFLGRCFRTKEIPKTIFISLGSTQCFLKKKTRNLFWRERFELIMLYISFAIRSRSGNKFPSVHILAFKKCSKK